MLFLFLLELLLNYLLCVYNAVIAVLEERMLRFDEQPWGKCAILKVDRREHPDESHLVLVSAPFVLSIFFSKALIKAQTNDPSPNTVAQPLRGRIVQIRLNYRLGERQMGK